MIKEPLSRKSIDTGIGGTNHASRCKMLHFQNGSLTTYSIQVFVSRSFCTLFGAKDLVWAK